MLKIVDIKNPVLRNKAARVKIIDKKIIKLIEEMKSTLLKQSDPEGVGLAAPQIGKNLQIFIMHYPEEGIKTKAIINPKVINSKSTAKKERRKNDSDILEGCLSIPHYYGPVKRKDCIKIKYLNEDGKEIVEEFNGFAAKIVQHEIDHLNGRLFIDHILENNSKLFYIRDDEYEEVEI